MREWSEARGRERGGTREGAKAGGGQTRRKSAFQLARMTQQTRAHDSIKIATQPQSRLFTGQSDVITTCSAIDIACTESDRSMADGKKISPHII